MHRSSLWNCELLFWTVFNCRRNKMHQTFLEQRALIFPFSRFTSLFQNRRSSLTGIGGTGLGSIPAGGLYDNCIDSVVFYGHDMYIMSDIPHMLKIQQDTLDTLARVSLGAGAPSTCSRKMMERVFGSSLMLKRSSQ